MSTCWLNSGPFPPRRDRIDGLALDRSWAAPKPAKSGHTNALRAARLQASIGKGLGVRHLLLCLSA